MFYRLINLLFRILVYRGYYKKYKLSRDFKFNGFLIRIYGEGEFICRGSGYIGYYSSVSIVKNSKLVVGDKVSISHNVKIYTSAVNVETLVKTGRKVNEVGNIVIGNNVLIGANCFICPGVNIGDNVVVGANSVVTRDLESNAVYAGAPAKIIRKY